MWHADANNAFYWIEPETITDDTVVTCTVGKITAALAEALKAVSIVRPEFKIGDKIIIEATVTGINKNAVSVVFDNVPEEMNRSFAYHQNFLAAAAKKA